MGRFLTWAVALLGAAGLVWLALSADGFVNGAGRRIDAWHDEKRGVTCWIVSGGNESSITCLPDSALVEKAEVSHD